MLFPSRPFILLLYSVLNLEPVKAFKNQEHDPHIPFPDPAREQGKIVTVSLYHQSRCMLLLFSFSALLLGSSKLQTKQAGLTETLGLGCQLQTEET